MKNSGLIMYYLVFILIIPFILSTYGINTGMLPFYLPLMVVLANVLTLSGIPAFQDLYKMKPDTRLSMASTHIINLVALIGVMWQSINQVTLYNNNVGAAAAYAVILFLVTFPLARGGLKFILRHADEYLREKSRYSFTNNWHLIITGLLYVVFLIGFQAILLSIVDSTQKASAVASVNKLNSINSRIANKLSLANVKN
jgi:hypothetical protein